MVYDKVDLLHNAIKSFCDTQPEITRDKASISLKGDVLHSLHNLTIPSNLVKTKLFC